MEPPRLGRVSHHRVAFRPSYQGWKPRTATKKSNMRSSFQTFLSGMETRRSSGARGAGSPFRPSYQGWKPYRWCWASRAGTLSDLPIRDGNGRQPSMKATKELRLSDLPIRDGNQLRSVRADADPRFQTFLSGMETLMMAGILADDSQLSDLPIRDGNSSTDHLPFVPLRTFRPSYQGWKPDQRSVWHRHSRLSDLPIRDGNTTTRNSGSAGRALSDLPIRDGNSR